MDFDNKLKVKPTIKVFNDSSKPSPKHPIYSTDRDIQARIEAQVNHGYTFENYQLSPNGKGKKLDIIVRQPNGKRLKLMYDHQDEYGNWTMSDYGIPYEELED